MVRNNFPAARIGAQYLAAVGCEASLGAGLVLGDLPLLIIVLMLKIDIIVIMIYYVDLESLKGVTYKRFQRQLHL